MRGSLDERSSNPARKLSRSHPERQRPSLNRNDQDRVGACLRLMYDHLREEPLSPKLQELVQRLTQTSPA